MYNSIVVFNNKEFKDQSYLWVAKTHKPRKASVWTLEIFLFDVSKQSGLLCCKFMSLKQEFPPTSTCHTIFKTKSCVLQPKVTRRGHILWQRSIRTIRHEHVCMQRICASVCLSNIQPLGLCKLKRIKQGIFGGKCIRKFDALDKKIVLRLHKKCCQGMIKVAPLWHSH